MSGPHGHHDPHAAGDGPVVLDIGGDVGAVVVTAPRSLVGREVEAVPEGYRPQDGPPVHVGVVDRPVPGGTATVPSAVFGTLPQGAYSLRLRDGMRDPQLEVTVVGGQVTTATWPS